MKKAKNLLVVVLIAGGFLNPFLLQSGQYQPLESSFSKFKRAMRCLFTGKPCTSEEKRILYKTGAILITALVSGSVWYVYRNKKQFKRLFGQEKTMKQSRKQSEKMSKRSFEKDQTKTEMMRKFNMALRVKMRAQGFAQQRYKRFGRDEILTQEEDIAVAEDSLLKELIEEKDILGVVDLIDQMRDAGSRNWFLFTAQQALTDQSEDDIDKTIIILERLVDEWRKSHYCNIFSTSAMYETNEWVQKQKQSPKLERIKKALGR